MSKFIFVTGGVCSSLGKGVAASSIGSLLECYGLKVTMIKCDPYINVDAGNISPHQHGEVYVTNDGAETDLDLGNYARFTHVNLTRANSITTGKVYQEVIAREREGRYNGRTVQVIPHITDEIKRRIMMVAGMESVDVAIVEVGGTVGDFESIPYLEAIRQMIRDQGRDNALSVHLTLIPEVTGGELKTKPTQHSVKLMQESGIRPDILVCRVPTFLDDDLRRKIGLFCNVKQTEVFSSVDVDRSIYELPILFHKQGMDSVILQKLGFTISNPDLSPWQNFLQKLTNAQKKVRIAMVGRYYDLDDCYKSVREALFAAAVEKNLNLEFVKIDGYKLESAVEKDSFFAGVDGIVVPPSHGSRGVLGMIAAAKYAREHMIPYLGIDIGMQVMAIDTARSVMGIPDADSTEFAPRTSYPVVSLPDEQELYNSATGLYRLGSCKSILVKGTKLAEIYGTEIVFERHRHRYEFDRRYRDDMEKSGLTISAFSAAGSGSIDGLADAFEWKNHPWGIGVQFQPEFKSKPTEPHPIFAAFIAHCAK